LHYTDLSRNTFAGTVTISVDVHPTPALADAIALHAVEISILSAKFQTSDDVDDGVKTSNDGNSSDNKSSKPIEAYEFRYTQSSQTCTMLFPTGTVAPATKGTLTIHFTGILNPLMHGLYRSTYQSLDGRTLTIATTQFEPTDARRAFPCFDEPALKSIFRLTVTMNVDPTRPGLRVMSNTEILSEHTTAAVTGPAAAAGGEGLKKTYEFAPTPLMSTYLLALIVAELDGISATPRSGPTAGVTTTVYAVPGKARQGQFCLEVATKCLDLYAEMLGVPYPLGKSDLVAVPDFAAGAMEVSV